MINDVKLALRIKTSNFDDEIQIYMDSVIDTLKRHNIDSSKITETDVNIRSLIIAYCKYQFNFQGESEKWGNTYEKMLRSIITDSRYK